MLLINQHPENRSIMASVLGAPNVGKSSLINHLLGMDLSIVSHRPQTTRNKFHCIATIDRTEVVFVDTPGLHKSNMELNRRINEQAREGSDGADINLLLIDLTTEIMPQFVNFQKNLDRSLGETWVVFTKSDRVENAADLPLAEVVNKAQEVFPSIEKYFVLSSQTGEGVKELTTSLCERAPNAPHYYTGGEISNRNERFFATEYVREQAFALLQDELPYELAVVIDEYKDISQGKTEKRDKDKDKPPLKAHISASILVNRPSQRAIVVGTKGAMIKEIGTRARQKIENMVDGSVHLNLHVKVSPKWFKNNFILEELGLPRAKDSARVWRQKS